MAPTNLICLRFLDRTRFKLAVCGFSVTSTVGEGTRASDENGHTGPVTLRGEEADESGHTGHVMLNREDQGNGVYGGGADDDLELSGRGNYGHLDPREHASLLGRSM